MTENENVPTEGGITGPPDPTKDATTPPGNGDVDTPDVEKGEDKLGQAGAGH